MSVIDDAKMCGGFTLGPTLGTSHKQVALTEHELQSLKRKWQREALEEAADKCGKHTVGAATSKWLRKLAKELP